MEAMALKRFVDDDEGESRLMDRYERMSFEIQLNRAIHFGRCLSHPDMPTTAISSSSSSSFYSSISKNNNNALPPCTTTEDEVRQGRRIRMMSRSTSHGLGGGFNKVFKKLLKPILWRKKSTTLTSTDDHILHAAQQPQLPNHNLTSWKKFSRSLRV